MNKDNSNCTYRNKTKKGCFYKIFIIILILIAISALLRKSIPLLISNMNTQTTAIETLDFNKKMKEIFYSGKKHSQNKILLVNIIGIITEDKEATWQTTADAEFVSEQLKISAKDDNIKAILLLINSPGGEVSTTDKIYHYIELIKKHNKPVIAYLDSEAASGGYYIAVAADYIVCNKLAITGSIGVIINNIKFFDLLTKIGVQGEVYKSGNMKDLLNPMRPTTPEEKQIIDSIVMETYNTFVDIVSKNRITKNKKLTSEYIKTSAVGDGRIFSGEQAYKLGLVDQLGYFEDAVDITLKTANLEDNDYQIITFEQELNFSDILKRFMKQHININFGIGNVDRNLSLQPGRMYYLNPTYLSY